MLGYYNKSVSNECKMSLSCQTGLIFSRSHRNKKQTIKQLQSQKITMIAVDMHRHKSTTETAHYQEEDGGWRKRNCKTAGVWNEAGVSNCRGKWLSVSRVAERRRGREQPRREQRRRRLVKDLRRSYTGAVSAPFPHRASVGIESCTKRSFVTSI